MEPTTAQLTVLTREAIEELAFEPLGPMEGVTHKVLWRDDVSMAGVLKVDGGHHIWVLSGFARVLGTELGPGSYVHIPRGIQHDIDASATDGCTVYYLYLRPASS